MTSRCCANSNGCWSSSRAPSEQFKSLRWFKVFKELSLRSKVLSLTPLTPFNSFYFLNTKRRIVNCSNIATPITTNGAM